MPYLEFINGQTKLNDTNLNKMQDLIKNDIEKMFNTGTWTPELTTTEEIAPTFEYISRRANYCKIGTLVFIDFYISVLITELNATNNFGLITGLPFTPAAVNGTYFGIGNLTLGRLYQMVADDTNSSLIVAPEGIRIEKNYGNTSSALRITPTTGNKYSIISASGWYECV